MRTAAILAGGRATRFEGRDKGALVVDGAPILMRQLHALRAVPEIGAVFVVGAASAPPGARAIRDIVPGQGPLSGIHAALSEPAVESVFVIACDMPYVSGAFVNYLFEAAAGSDAAVPRTRRGYHPLCAVYTRACLEPIARRLANGRLKAIDVLEDVRVRIVTEDEIARFGDASRLLTNVNTPADYADLVALPGHKH
jgi:molybdopterin-guanine dinucleotide biosynthesis protein A